MLISWAWFPPAERLVGPKPDQPDRLLRPCTDFQVIKKEDHPERDLDSYEAGIQKGVWVSTSFNEYGTPVVPIRKALLPGQEKETLRVCGGYSVKVNS